VRVCELYKMPLKCVSLWLASYYVNVNQSDILASRAVVLVVKFSCRRLQMDGTISPLSILYLPNVYKTFAKQLLNQALRCNFASEQILVRRIYIY
jgi:hypothetical protein